ncbi:Ribonuclease H domain [Sesbania bispinosa]|nr:Ribonuclease H domain [Sesbania bispinosa]
MGESVHVCEVATGDSPQELQDTPRQGEEELDEIDVSDDNDKKRPLFVSKALSKDENDRMVQLLKEYKNVFAWDYDEALVTHNLAIYANSRPVKQVPRNSTPTEAIRCHHRQINQRTHSTRSRGGGMPRVLSKQGAEDVETRYPKQERYCLALVYAAQKYRHYFQVHTMDVMTKSEGIKYMLQNPSPTGRVSRWALILSEYDLRLVHPQRLRSQALANMLAISSEGCEEHVAEEIKGEMPEVNMCEGVHGKDWWTLQFDGTPTNPAGGAGVVLSNEKGEVFAFSHYLSFPCTKNEAEYKALVLGLHMAKNLGVNKLRIRGDSNLVIRQIKGEYGTKEPSLATYRDEVPRLIDTFEEVEAMNTPRAENRYADALATIGSKEIRESGEEIVIFRRVEQSSLAMIPHQERPEDWRNAIVEQLKQGICSKTTREYQKLCGALYRKTSDGLLMKCVSEEEGVRKMDNLHHKICGDAGPSLYKRMQRVGMFWLTMKMHYDTMQKMCKRCCTLGEEMEVNLVDEDWRAPLKKFLSEGELPMEPREAAKLKKKS